MSPEFFIAKRLYLNKERKGRVSRPAVQIAMWGTAIGLAVMIISLCIVIGFKHEVRDKVIGFGSDIQVLNSSQSADNNVLPIEADDSLMDRLTAINGISHVQRFSTKTGVIGAGDEFQGFILKGVGSEYDMNFFRRYMVEGELPQFSDSTASNKILISRSLAQKMKVKTGDKVLVYFVQDNIRVRRPVVAGIYQTNFSDFDNSVVVSDIYTVNRLNDWETHEATGMEISIDNYDDLTAMADSVNTATIGCTDRFGGKYYTQTIEQLNPSLFGWLGALDTNVWVIFILILGVAGFTMISGLLILILERANMIGVLKSMGAQNRFIRTIFLNFSIFLIGRGMLLGNLIGLSLCFLQQWLGIIKLDPSMYYADRVPIEFNWPLIILLNAAMFILSVSMMVIPSALISRIYPTQAIRFG